LGEQLLHLAQSVQDPALLLEAYMALGAVLTRLGELTSARAHLEQSIALYHPLQHGSLAFRAGQDTGIACLSEASYTLWVLGYPHQARQRNHEALTLAQERAHPFSVAFALSFAALVHQHRGEVQLTQERAEAAVTLSSEHGFPLWLGIGTVLRGWALAMQGRGEEGIAQMRQGLMAWQATGAELTRPYCLALLAEAYGTGGQAEEGLSVIDEAFGVVSKTGERCCEAELYRLRGALLRDLSADDQAEVERCFRQALAVARHQHAKSLELRAALSLSRLWQGQGKRKEAYQLLTEMYGWFTEGFDTADLQEAKALLEELS
jgi:predicted ATPase